MVEMAVQADKKSGKKKDAHGMKYLCVLVALVAIGFGAYWQQETIKDYASVLVQDKTSDQGKLPSRYESDLVTMQVRHLVSDLECEADFMPEVLSKDGFIHVKDAMASPPKDDSSVFFMLNGRNEGVYASWNGDFDCIGLSSKLAAKWLGADQDVMANGVRLYSQMGHPIRSAEDLVSSKRLVHILLDFQLWQWPGIEKGYKYHLEDGVVMTTVGMRPKVFDVEFFLTQEEADKAIEMALPTMSRSLVIGSKDSGHQARTSHTAFVEDSVFSRDIRKRSAAIARLPSPSFAEQMQVVKYEAGQFYRKHMDTFHSSPIEPEGYGDPTYADYITWATWARDRLREQDQSRVPEQFREGNVLFPDPDSTISFPNALLTLFHSSVNASNLLRALQDQKWSDWIYTNVEKNASGVMEDLLKAENRPSYLPRIVKTWEKELGMPELFYTFPKVTPTSISQFYHWIQWAKERISYLGDDTPAIARTNGWLYPTFDFMFQRKLLIQVILDYSKELISEVTNEQVYAWLRANVFKKEQAMFQALQHYPGMAELAIKSWERRVAHDELRYQLPTYVKHFHPQRYATLFLYLNNQTKVGGETVFPYSLDRFSNETIERKGMDECSSGLAVPPRGLHASLFYHQTPEGDVDWMSLHGGCPPEEGIKWGANSFMWNADTAEAADIWSKK